MQSLSLLLRRTYATIPSSEHPGARVARIASSPLKVRQRRAEALAKARAKAGSKQKTSTAITTSPQLPEIRERRSRIRGVLRKTGPDGEQLEKVVGQRIYLPNIIFKMVRNHTPPGKAYNPFEATFRIPQSVTKTDVRSYLTTIYGIDCTYIRTDNYLPRWEPWHRKDRAKSAYKRAVVGLVKPFYYPLAVEDMNGRDRWLRTTELEERFRMEESKRLQKLQQLIMTQKTAKDWKLRGDQWQTRAKILKNIMQKREEREERLRTAVATITLLREQKAEKVASSS